MPVNITDAISAYANAGRISGAGAAARDSGGGFADVLRKATEGVVDTLHKGETASLQAATGKADLTQVTEAVSNAEVALQTVVAVRDRVVSAYQEILRMPM